MAVAGLLERDHGKAVSIVNLSAFPALLRLGARFSSAERGGFFIDPQGRRIDFGAIESFWWRRPQALLPDPAITDAQAQHFARAGEPERALRRPALLPGVVGQ